MSKKDGGPAFPAPEWFESAIEGETGKFMYDHPGMTLRDWFAGQALAWHPVSVRFAPTTRACGVTNGPTFAYSAADSMLAAREEKS